MMAWLKEGIAFQMAHNAPGLKHLGMVLICCLPIAVGVLGIGRFCDKPSSRGILPKLLYRRFGRNGLRAWWIFIGLFCLFGVFFFWVQGTL